MALFESYERRIEKINSVLSQYGISSVEECREICKAAGFDPYEIVKGIQPICFENACWAYCVGAAIALKKNVQTAAEAAEAIGIGLQSFCIPGSVAEDRKVGLGHGNLGAMLLRDETKCFAFLAGHESFAAAEGAIGIVRNANKARKEPLRVILNGLGIWNDYLMPYLALPSGKAKTITVEIASFVGQYTARWDIVFAGTVISIVPALIIFCMFQKYFVKGITAGAAKG